MLDSTYKFIGGIIKIPKVNITLNIIGLIVSIIGVILCIFLIFGGEYVNTKVNHETDKVQYNIDNKIDRATTLLSFVNGRTSSLLDSNILSAAIANIPKSNGSRLTTLASDLKVFNFNGVMNPVINKLNDTAANLNSLETTFVNSNATKVASGLKIVNKVEAKLTSIKQNTDNTMKNIRLFALYLLYSSVLIGLIFLAGELTLLVRCIRHIKLYYHKLKKTTAKKQKT